MANTSKRGFASMDPSRQKDIASKGGRAAHAKGTAHEFTSDEARVAGRKGGEAVSRDRAHMSAIGREGGHSRGRARQEQRPADVSTSSNVQQSSSGNNNGGMTARESNERPSYIGQEHNNDRGTASPNNSNASSSGSSSRSNETGRDFQGRRDY
ncbi:MAG: Stress-induced protein repeat-containing protein [Acidobacteria bacterium]|nr:Stress-induced protein repeat-containing protein [Acidobacteriota bacterium]